MSESATPSVVFDAGHGEEVTPEESDLSQLVNLLQSNGFQFASLHDTITLAALKPYSVCVLGNPLNTTFSGKEIAAIETYVRAGGGLLLISGATIFGKGGDRARGTNLTAVAERFGLGFSERAIQRSPSQADTDGVSAGDIFQATVAAKHPVSQGALHLQLVSSTVVAPGKTSQTLFRVGDAPAAPAVVVADTFGKGRVLALGGATPFFDSYIRNVDHEVFLVQAFRWLGGLSAARSVHRLAPVEPEPRLPTESVATLREIRARLESFEKEVKELKEVILTTIDELRRALRNLQEKR